MKSWRGLPCRKVGNTMKKIQKYRLGIQILCLFLTVMGFFTNFKATTLVIVGVTLFTGTFYCGWVCPYGFIQEVFSKLGKRLGIKKRKMPKNIQRILVFSRYIVFGVVMLIGTDFIFSVMSFDPRVNFGNLLLGNTVKIGAIIVLSLFLMVSLLFERPFCNYLCYEGAKYGLMSSLRFLTIKRNEATCVDCKKCDKACPMNIEVSKCSNIRSTQCINCFQCISSCPVKDTLNYGKISINKNQKKKNFAVVAGVLVVISSFIVFYFLNSSNFLEKIKSEIQNSNTLQKVAEEKVKEESTENSIVSSKNTGAAAGIKDGVYTGEGEGFRGMITVEVKVENEKIVSVEVIEYRDDFKWFNRANSILPASIVREQSTEVDLVSGATYSSIGIRDSVKNALEKAK